MPFDVVDIASRVEAMARYYADEWVPGTTQAAQRGWALLQATPVDTLRQVVATATTTPSVLAWPVEPPGCGYEPGARPAAYRVVASDGSSAVSDAHYPARYVVLHVARVLWEYAPSHCTLVRQPRFLFHPAELEVAVGDDEDPIPVEGPVVDTMRAFEELQVLWQAVQGMSPDRDNRPLLCLMDAIILWTHRGMGSGAGHSIIRDDFLARSAEVLEQLRRAGVPLVSFASNPHHHEVVNTLLACFCPNGAGGSARCATCPADGTACGRVRGLVDADLFKFLEVGQRSALFVPMYQGSPLWRLPEGAMDPRLASCYLQTEGGIARIETPLWVYEQGLLPEVQSILLDQGREVRAEAAGYPVALSLAHDEAMLSGGDRRFIQVLVEEALARARVDLHLSPKAEAKRR